MDNKDGQEKKTLPVYKTMEEFMRAHDVAEKDPLPPPPSPTSHRHAHAGVQDYYPDYSARNTFAIGLFRLCGVKNHNTVLSIIILLPPR
ncbi:hypothetical protein [Enterobacter sp.]|uniref:hypothetical protein n=1 Tax=Enterobacter sp. TaxID=42895 RepID=UPI00296F0C9F|nr:hypothetical protein [Enterobacter sp.]